MMKLQKHVAQPSLMSSSETPGKNCDEERKLNIYPAKA